MMLEREPIRDPNVAAYLVTHGGMRLVVEQRREDRRPRQLLDMLAALFGAGAPLLEERPRADPPLEPGTCVRQSHVVFATPEFAQRMEIYLHSYRIEAKERLEQAR